MVFFPSTVPTSGREASGTSWWLYTLLGVILLIAGAFVLGEVVLASVISAIFIAWAIVIAGIFQIIHAFSARGWKGFVFDGILGVLYIAGGAILLSNPVAASLTLTFALGVIWIVSGLFRVTLAAVLWREGGMMLLLSGLLGIAAGAIILTRWPASGLWVLGLCLGIDLIFHGVAWIAYSLSVHPRPAPQRA
ncbi:MAG: HdeD family acid-resistance protein [Rhodomicrobium sp.]